VAGWSFKKCPPSLELDFVISDPPGVVSAYTFYRSPKGEKIKHGLNYEMSLSGRVFVRSRYENGSVVEGSAKID
jgi:hypothetical protein